MLRPYGVESVINGGWYLGRSSTRRLRQQVWYYLVVGKTKTKTKKYYKTKTKLKLKNISKRKSHCPATLAMLSRQSTKSRDNTDEAQQYIMNCEDRSVAARRLHCFAAAALSHQVQGTVQRSGSRSVCWTNGIAYWVREAPPDTHEVGRRKGEGSKQRG